MCDGRTECRLRPEQDNTMYFLLKIMGLSLDFFLLLCVK